MPLDQSRLNPLITEQPGLAKDGGQNQGIFFDRDDSDQGGNTLFRFTAR